MDATFIVPAAAAAVVMRDQPSQPYYAGTSAREAITRSNTFSLPQIAESAGTEKVVEAGGLLFSVTRIKSRPVRLAEADPERAVLDFFRGAAEDDIPIRRVLFQL